LPNQNSGKFWLKRHEHSRSVLPEAQKSAWQGTSVKRLIEKIIDLQKTAML
jgi:hypothetical protein